MKRKTDLTILRWISEVSGRKKIYIGLLILIQMVLGISSVFYALILRNVIDTAVAGSRNRFFLTMASFVGLVLFQIILRAMNRHFEEYARATMENRFKNRLFGFLLTEDYEQMTMVHSGEWMNRLTSDTVVVADGLSQIVPGVAGMLTKMVGALLMILVLEPRFTYILLPGGVLLIILTYAFRKQLKKLHKMMQEADGRLRVFMQESLSSMLVVRAFVKESQVLDEAVDKMEAHKKARMRKNRFSNICNIGFGSAMQGAYVLGAGVCGYGILTGTMSYGTLMAILQLISQIQSPFANITGYLPKYYAMQASAERLREVEYTDRDQQAFDQMISGNNHIRSLAEIRDFYDQNFEGICLKNADFTYKRIGESSGRELPVVLKHLKLSVRKGEYVAFTGPSGCGKSTVLKIMMCLYNLDAGTCMIKTKQGEVPMDQTYRRLFAYVPQGNHLMSGSIREIIAFSDREAMKQEERIYRALEIACGKDFVMGLPSGIDTILGERGLGLSEGQMQRIAIARAVFSEHPVLMLDESTSALDEATEKQLLKNLRAMTDQTVLIVTHRSAVLSICDQEIAFSEAGVVERSCGGNKR